MDTLTHCHHLLPLFSLILLCFDFGMLVYVLIWKTRIASIVAALGNRTFIFSFENGLSYPRKRAHISNSERERKRRKGEKKGTVGRRNINDWKTIFFLKEGRVPNLDFQSVCVIDKISASDGVVERRVVSVRDRCVVTTVSPVFLATLARTRGVGYVFQQFFLLWSRSFVRSFIRAHMMR